MKFETMLVHELHQEILTLINYDPFIFDEVFGKITYEVDYMGWHVSQMSKDDCLSLLKGDDTQPPLEAKIEQIKNKRRALNAAEFEKLGGVAEIARLDTTISELQITLQKAKVAREKLLAVKPS